MPRFRLLRYPSLTPPNLVVKQWGTEIPSAVKYSKVASDVLVVSHPHIGLLVQKVHSSAVMSAEGIIEHFKKLVVILSGELS
jgi:hypothetical protein